MLFKYIDKYEYEFMLLWMNVILKVFIIVNKSNNVKIKNR